MQHIRFASCWVDLTKGQLWREHQQIALRPKSLVVLHYLLTHRDRYVSETELLTTCWAGMSVSRSVVKGCIRDIRRALKDDATAPQFIDNQPHLGYRFIAPVAFMAEDTAYRHPGKRAVLGAFPLLPSFCVGRDAEIDFLQQRLDSALAGKRQIVCIAGEPGIGKTTLLEAFLARVATRRDVLVTFGQGIEHYGAGEAYQPILDGLQRLCRERNGRQVLACLRRHAPMWLAQLPSLISPEERTALQHQLFGATAERMVREFATVLERLTEDQGLIFVFEDLHWSDLSTLNALLAFIQKDVSARLLLIGAYRPAEVTRIEQPLKELQRNLHLHGSYTELPLDYLNEQQVTAYVALRFGDEIRLSRLGPTLYQQSKGNPLFMVNILNEFLTQGDLSQEQGRWEFAPPQTRDVAPQTLQHLITQQVDRLPGDEQRVLEAASIAGIEFTAASVAAALKSDLEAVEDRCETIARHGHFLQENGLVEWPDGTVSGCYAFRHALYPTVIQERLGAARRRRLHLLIGERKEHGYKKRAAEIAEDLAVHFEQARDFSRAVKYSQQAGENAVRRYANEEAIRHFTKGLELLKTLPDAPERDQQELTLQLALGGSLMMTKGFAAPEVERSYSRSLQLCQQLGKTPRLLSALRGLATFYMTRAEYKTASALMLQLLAYAQSLQDPALLLMAHQYLGGCLCLRGEFAAASAHFDQTIAAYNPKQHRLLTFYKVYSQNLGAWALLALGYPDQARKRNHEAFIAARELPRPFERVYSLFHTALFHLYCREGSPAQELSEEAMTLATDLGLSMLLAWATIAWGWALAEQGKVTEGIVHMRQGLTAFRATGAKLSVPTWLWSMAEACRKAGQIEEGLRLITEGLEAVHNTGEGFSEVHLYRLKGELTFQSSIQRLEASVPSPHHSKSNIQTEAEAEACFLKAIAVAQRQQAKLLELRAAMSLSRLWRHQGKRHAAYALLTEIYNWFTEGFDTKDLQDAKALLEELGA